MYTLYVIPGSHACRSAMLMLEHKGLLYRRVEVPTLLHPVDGGPPSRAGASGARPLGVEPLDR